LKLEIIYMQKRTILYTLVALSIVAWQAVIPHTIQASSLSTTTLISNGVEGHGTNDYVNPTGPGGTTDDGRFFVFSTSASNMVAHDTNDMFDVFMYDRVTKKLELISHTALGLPADRSSYNPTISGDGRYIAYMSMASNIVPGTAAFCADAEICANIVVYDRQTKTTSFANQTATGKRIDNDLRTIGDNPPFISSNGRFVAYVSEAAISSDDTNDNYDAFVYDRQTRQTRAASITSSGKFDPHASTFDVSISGDGRMVAFSTWGHLVPEDTDYLYDDYVHDMQTGQTQLVSITPTGKSGNSQSFEPVVSDNGKFVAFMSQASNLVARDTNGTYDIFLRNLQTNETSRISMSTKGNQGNHHSFSPDISSDGRFVIFCSWASNFVAHDDNDMGDVFLYDGFARTVRRVSRPSHDAGQATGGSLGTWQPVSISGNGTTVTFTSDAKNLATPAPTTDFPHLYSNYNPVVAIPFYDPTDYIDLL